LLLLFTLGYELKKKKKDNQFINLKRILHKQYFINEVISAQDGVYFRYYYLLLNPYDLTN